MADTKISALPASTTPLAGTETLPIVQSGVTKQVSVANLTAGRAVGSAGGTFTDNFVQGTAAKGVNFTANTPAAGMTSQLLNAYEEGDYTATITSTIGAITATTQALKYTKIGRIVTITGNFTITTNGTAAGRLVITLPITAATANMSGAGTETGATGFVFGIVGASINSIQIFKYDTTYLGGNGYVFPLNFSYQAA